MNPALNRREFVVSATALGAAAATGLPQTAEGAPNDQPHQATGARVGEVTDSSAIVWVRLTAQTERAPKPAGDGKKPAGDGKKSASDNKKPTGDIGSLEGACPGAAGRVRVRYGRSEDLSDAKVTDWAAVSAEGDFIHQFALTGLEPGAQYYYANETEDAAGQAHAPLRGKFRTAPAAATPARVRFCVMTCQAYRDRGNPDGHGIYPSMQALDPEFACLTGDLVYYDSDPPAATNVEMARYHWERMFSLPRLVAFTKSTATYWLKDDHDTLKNDTWPGATAGELTFAEGQEIFRQQAPFSSGPAYRTFRWGRDLQVWLSDGRDFRSPNKMADGPEKTIWGAEQKAWFEKTVAESNARFKVLVSPTPFVGPDRKNKNDNHANAGFEHEGNELRAWLAQHAPELIVICGDRHWQYHSVHPKTGLNEFSVGAASDEHAGGTPGEDKTYHRFHRVKGGFLSVTVEPTGDKATLLCELRDVGGNVVYSWQPKA